MAKIQLEDRDAVSELLSGPAKKSAESEQPGLDAAEAALHAGEIDAAITLANGLVSSLCTAESSLPKRSVPKGLPAGVPDTDAPMPIGEIQLRWAMQIARERWLPFLDLFPFEYAPVVYAAITAELDGAGIARLEQLCDYDELGRLRRRAELWQHGWTAYTTADTEADKLAAAGQLWQFIVAQTEPALYLQVIEDAEALPFLLANLNYAAITDFFKQHKATLKSHNSPLDAYQITTDMADTHTFLQKHYDPEADIDECSESDTSELIQKLEYDSSADYRAWIAATAPPTVFYSALEALDSAEEDDAANKSTSKPKHKRTLYLLSHMTELAATHLRPLVTTLNAITLESQHIKTTLPTLIIHCADLLSKLITELPQVVRDELTHQDDATTKANRWFQPIAYSLLSLAKPNSTTHLLATELTTLLDNPNKATKLLDAITVAGIFTKLRNHTPRVTARKSSSAGSNPTALIKASLMDWAAGQTGATFDPTAVATTTTDLTELQSRYRSMSLAGGSGTEDCTASYPELGLDRLAALSSQYGSHGSAASLGDLVTAVAGSATDDALTESTESTTSSDGTHKPLTLEELICFAVAIAAGAANLTDRKFPPGFHTVYQTLATNKDIDARVLMQLALQYQAALDNIRQSDEHRDKKREVLRAQLYSKLRMLTLIPTGEDGALLASMLSRRERMTRSVRKSLSRSGPIDWSHHHSDHDAMQALHGILDAADGGSYARFCAAMESGYTATDTLPPRASQRESLHADFVRIAVIVYLEQLLYPTKHKKDPRKDMDDEQTTTLEALDNTLNRFREDQAATVVKIVTAVRDALTPLETSSENRCRKKIVAPTLAFCRAVLNSPPLAALDSGLIIGEGRLSSVFHHRYDLTPPEPTLGSPGSSTRGASTSSP